MTIVDQDGFVIPGTSKSLRNARIIDRSRLRARNMSGQAAAFAVYHGGAPNYRTDGSVNTTYGYGGNVTEVAVNNNINVSFDQWENGSLAGGALHGSGTVTVVPSGEVKHWVF